MTRVTVIIPTFNEEKVISECLTSLAGQTYQDLEIIVIDDGSIDKTLEVLSKFKISNLKFQILRQPHKGPGSARNMGAERARGEVLVFVDADMTFDPDFIEKLVEPIVHGKVKGTFSKEEFVANPKNLWSACWGLNEGWEEGRRHPKNYPDKQKVFRAIFKSEFLKVQGFTPIGYTDDWTLSDKLGYVAVNAPGAKFYHKNPETLSEVIQQAEWIGKRKYKLGKLGTVVALVRSSLPVSFVTGFVKSILFFNPSFIIFKLAYDFGVFSGAFRSLLGGSSAR
ncbi:MAG: Glycosyl transferase family protein [Microgenomates group bacterium Gr01-1014_5]|nr:MAG: Glycosyl transferase family protein [Microgenomates group bacterium Gr01-1014_5]